jgi:OPT oligopeptide transporter protein
MLAMYYTNFKNTAFLPANTVKLFANDATPYNITKIMTPDVQLDEKAYQEYSPPFFTARYLIREGGYFCLYPMNFLYMIANQWITFRDAGVAFWTELNTSSNNWRVGHRNGAKSLARGQPIQPIKDVYRGDGVQRSIYDGFDDAPLLSCPNTPKPRTGGSGRYCSSHL